MVFDHIRRLHNSDKIKLGYRIFQLLKNSYFINHNPELGNIFVYYHIKDNCSS